MSRVLSKGWQISYMCICIMWTFLGHELPQLDVLLRDVRGAERLLRTSHTP